MYKKYMPFLIIAEVILLLCAVGIVVLMKGSDSSGLLGPVVGLASGVIFLLLSFAFSALRRARYNKRVSKRRDHRALSSSGIYIKPISDKQNDSWRYTTQELGKLLLYGSIEDGRSGKRSLLVTHDAAIGTNNKVVYGIYDTSKNDDCLAILILSKGKVTIKPVSKKIKIKWNDTLLNKNQNLYLNSGDKLGIRGEKLIYRDAAQTLNS